MDDNLAEEEEFLEPLARKMGLKKPEEGIK